MRLRAEHVPLPDDRRERLAVVGGRRAPPPRRPGAARSCARGTGTPGPAGPRCSGVARSQRTSLQPMCGSFRPGALQPRAPRPRSMPSPLAPPCSSERSNSSCIPRQSPSSGTPACDALAQQLVQAQLARIAPSPAGTRPRPAAPARPSRAAARGSRAHLHARADVLERLLDRAAVAHAVVDDRDLDRLAARSLMRSASPSCSARPSRSGRSRTASRSARANALKAASIMWCAFAARLHPQVQRQLRGVRQRAEELLGQLVLEAAGRARRQLAPRTA